VLAEKLAIPLDIRGDELSSGQSHGASHFSANSAQISRPAGNDSFRPWASVSSRIDASPFFKAMVLISPGAYRSMSCASADWIAASILLPADPDPSLAQCLRGAGQSLIRRISAHLTIILGNNKIKAIVCQRQFAVVLSVSIIPKQ